jgi:hypothetical protein
MEQTDKSLSRGSQKALSFFSGYRTRSGELFEGAECFRAVPQTSLKEIHNLILGMSFLSLPHGRFTYFTTYPVSTPPTVCAPAQKVDQRHALIRTDFLVRAGEQIHEPRNSSIRFSCLREATFPHADQATPSNEIWLVADQIADRRIPVSGLAESLGIGRRLCVDGSATSA